MAKSDDGGSGPAWVRFGLLLGILGFAVRGALDASAARKASEQVLQEVRAASKAAVAAEEATGRTAAEVAELKANVDMLAANVGSVEENLRKVYEEILYGSGGGLGFDPTQEPMIFTPELRETLRRTAAVKGILLEEDRVSVPGEIVLRQGQLEFFAVFPGGKVHESVLVLTGKQDEEGRGAAGLGATLNSCLQAIGLTPGKPLRILPGGKTIPPSGTPVHLSVEWEEEGKPVRVHAEDMLWDRERNRTLEPGKFLYVGSFFDRDGYVPDLAGDAVAVYSVPTTIIDLDDPRAADDTLFLACAPRIPAERTRVRLVFSREPLEPTRTWDPEDPAKRTDPGAPPPAEEGEKDEEESGDDGGK